MEESALVWRRAPWCGEGRPGMDEDATGKGRVAHLVRKRAPLRREKSENTSDTS